MRKWILAGYGLLAYLVGLIANTYAIGFLGGFEVPRLIGNGDPEPWALALLINTGLLALFGVQHSLMARESFKRRLQTLVAPEAERSTYVLMAGLVYLAVLGLWQPIPQVIWSVPGAAGQALVMAVFWFGIVLSLAATMAINHFDLFGLRQVWLAWRGERYQPPAFQTPFLYRIVRHPMMTGLLIAFWATPHMTVGRLVFALGMSVYVLIGIAFEERSLERSFGEAYRAYRRRTPALFPRLPGLGRRPAVPGRLTRGGPQAQK